MSSQKPRAQSPSSHAGGSDRSRGPRQRGAHGRRPPSPQHLPEHAHAKPRLPPRVPAQPSSATAGATASPLSGGTSQRVAAPRAAPKGERRSPATAISRDEPQQAHAKPNPNPNPNPNPDSNPNPNPNPNPNGITRSRALSAHALLTYSTDQAHAAAPALASGGTPADYTPLASRGTAAQHTPAPGAYNQRTGESNQPRHSRQLAQRERGVISGQGGSPEGGFDDQSAPTTPTPTPKTPGWAAAVQWASAAEKVLAAHPQP